MGSLLENLESLDDARLTERGEEWIRSALAEARELAEKNLSAGELEIAKGSLDILAKHRGPLARLGSAGLTAVLASLAAGEEERARQLFAQYHLQGVSDFEARRAASREAARRVVQDTDEKVRAWKEVKAMAMELGKVALTKVLPLLLAAL